MNIRKKMEQWKAMKNLVNETVDLWTAIQYACNTEGIKLGASKRLLLARGIIAYYRHQPTPPTPQQETKE